MHVRNVDFWNTDLQQIASLILKYDLDAFRVDVFPLDRSGLNMMGGLQNSLDVKHI